MFKNYILTVQYIYYFSYSSPPRRPVQALQKTTSVICSHLHQSRKLWFVSTCSPAPAARPEWNKASPSAIGSAHLSTTVFSLQVCVQASEEALLQSIRRGNCFKQSAPPSDKPLTTAILERLDLSEVQNSSPWAPQEDSWHRICI